MIAKESGTTAPRPGLAITTHGGVVSQAVVDTVSFAGLEADPAASSARTSNAYDAPQARPVAE